MQPVRLTQRFDEALLLAVNLHRNQLRKGSSTPYLAHLLGVTSLVLEDGGDEDQAIAALLHDAAEDQGGRKILEDIRIRFGDRVANIVDGCTDTYENPKPAWRPRKEKYIEHLRTAPPDVWRVSLADKLHNARSILVDLKRSGDGVWQRFTGGKEGVMWYYRSLVKVFKELDSSILVGELSRVVDDIEHISATGVRRTT
jgi:(p)ppGpp synthase/HD superfamily hydrolase